MASLNLSSNGPSITKSYQAVVNATFPTTTAGSSATYAQWALFSVTAPLVSAFQQDSGKESVLKVQSTGDGELSDLVEDFSDGKIQFAFVKVKDSNTALPKNVLIAWCGEGVPERTKGYFGSHLAAVAKLLHGYHVQVTARTERDLNPESIVRKVADASGSKYAGSDVRMDHSAPPPPLASKPVFMPTSTGGVSGGFNPLASQSRANAAYGSQVDEDGWGHDAPQVTRTRLENVQPAYQPTKVNMGELLSQKPEVSKFNGDRAQTDTGSNSSNVVKGVYQPVGKVDIAAIRRQAQETGGVIDDRPTPIKSSYEPIGKVDIAAIRAKAQGPGDDAVRSASSFSQLQAENSAQGQQADEEPKSLADRSAAFTQSGRLSSMPKPRVANKFGSSANSFTGTKAPIPGSFESTPAAPVGLASRTFADEGGKTPAQIWAEQKARKRGDSSAATTTMPSSPPRITAQTSGGGDWKSGYSGKSWAPVQTTRTGQSASSADQQHSNDGQGEDEQASLNGGVGAMRDRFARAAPTGAPADESRTTSTRTDVSSQSIAGGPRGVPMPGMPPRRQMNDDAVPEAEPVRVPTPPVQPRSPTPPTPPVMTGSPIRVAMPVARGEENEMQAPEERFSQPPIPTESLERALPAEKDLEDEPHASHDDPARGASQAAATKSLGGAAVAAGPSGARAAGERALVMYDYEKAEDNELELKEGEYVTNIERVDEDWWMGQNSKGETGLFPSNYVEVQKAEPKAQSAASVTTLPTPTTAAAPSATSSTKGPTATAQYDYEAVEDNELSFPDGAKITGLEFPDEDWWFGHYGGSSGLFPANYVTRDD